jgi:general secretion pathway protein C
MAAISLDRSGLAQTLVVSIVTIIALAALCVVLAYWTWVWFAPTPLPRAQVTSASLRIESAYNLFGDAQSNASGVAQTGLAIKLLGIVAARRGRGYAVVQLEPREIRALHEGEDISPGIRLAEIHTDHVVLMRNGAPETLAWPEKSGAAREQGSFPPKSVPEEPRGRRERD